MDLHNPQKHHSRHFSQSLVIAKLVTRDHKEILTEILTNRLQGNVFIFIYVCLCYILLAFLYVYVSVDQLPRKQDQKKIQIQESTFPNVSNIDVIFL